MLPAQCPAICKSLSQASNSSTGKEDSRGDFIAVFKSLKGDYKKAENSLFSLAVG